MTHVAYIIVQCPSLTSSIGTYRCNLGSDEVISYEDICGIVCKTGYEMTGSDTRTCQSDGSWSGSDGVCRRGMRMFTCKLNYYYYVCQFPVRPLLIVTME